MLPLDVPTAAGGGSNAAQIIAAAGTAVSLVIGALVLWPTRRRRDRVAAVADVDPEDRSARLRERITALETRVDANDKVLEAHGDEIGLLRNLQVTVESLTRPARRGGARGD